MDIDGTLLDKNGAIAAEDKDALAEAVAAGIQVALSTGRVVQASLKILNQLSLDGYHIFFDGALVYNPEKGEEVYAKPISPELVRQMVNFLHRNEVNLDFFSTTRFFVEQESWASALRREFFGLEPVVGDFARVLPRERIVKGTLVVRSTEEKEKAAAFCRYFKDSLTFSPTKTPAYPDVDFINVVAAGVTKGEALEALVTHLGIPLSEVVAIGDGDNDASLLSRVGLAIAMDNATNELKELADRVTLDVDHHGVAAAIRQFLL